MQLVKYRNHRAPAISNLFDEFFRGSGFGDMVERNLTSTAPAVNIRETETAYHLEVAAPGLKKEDFKIEIDKDDRLIISAERQKEQAEEQEGIYSRKEFSFSSMKRSFILPDHVDAEKISASCENGILKVELPKREEPKVKKRRIIEIG